jgi:hypothetical protein
VRRASALRTARPACRSSLRRAARKSRFRA